MDVGGGEAGGRARLEVPRIAVPEGLAVQLSRIAPPWSEFGFAAIVDGRNSFSIESDGLRLLSAASLAKLFIAGEAFRRIGSGDLRFETQVPIEASNRVGDPNGLDPTRRDDLLVAADSATVRLLLSQMLNASSNTAANVLIDLLERAQVNSETVARFGWTGSQVTRKYLPRHLESAGHQVAPPTLTCPRHISELLYLASRGSLNGATFDRILISHLLNGVRHRRSLAGDSLAVASRYFHKIGSLEGRDRRGNLIRWQHEAGVLQRGATVVVLCVMSCYRPPSRQHYFPLPEMQRAIFDGVLLLEGSQKVGPRNEPSRSL
ncbi:serine hydrolase [Actinoplanes xinjiangensis]|uniref:Beta-lactamase family protein n=1 Tax=Actinoplanes xinjiangensis TaxID=512350 RepID=A0A316FI34_9ACTN|nr:serine hydrolase [Actinoplanes xinjiangensis]PWK47775.1 beta-lactamase family protein [Actinoplanes xinjiangensis]